MNTFDTENSPQELNDIELATVSAGGPFQTFGPLNAKMEQTIFDDGEVVRKAIFADASGSGNVTGNGGATTPTSYTFHEDIDDNLVPVTYVLG